MEIPASGVQSDEKPPIQQAFAGHHDVRCLDALLTEDTAHLAAGHEIIDTTLGNVPDYTAGRRSANVLVSRN
ncbi:hypothetical protein ACIPC1_01095 [Streptomyces sp. NPDC087263]|uniref:hypothetical protein n=1 Tax=Streptomyces sp. NPDC087263 TaxID=3365773 RepID=UPI0038224177